VIVLNMIVRNAADTVLAALESVREIVDFAVIGFAGESDDGTEEQVINWLAEHFPERNVIGSFEFKDFADARNRVLALTPEPFFQDPNTWMIWLDADDTVLGAAELPGILEQMPPHAGAIQFPYIYQQDEHGNPLVVHDRERLIRLSVRGWTWFRPVHETLRTATPHGIVRLDNLTWVHDWKANQGSRSARNLALLETYHAEHPEDRRTGLYIAHSHYSNERWAEALEWFARYYHEPDNELDLKYIESLIREGGLHGKVKTMGWISSEEKVELMANSLGCVFIPFGEDYGYVTLEAFHSRKPVITCADSGGPLDFVRDGVTGLVAEPDPRAIAGAMDRLFYGMEAARKMGQAGYDSVVSLRMTWDRIIERLAG